MLIFNSFLKDQLPWSRQDGRFPNQFACCGAWWSISSNHSHNLRFERMGSAPCTTNARESYHPKYSWNDGTPSLSCQDPPVADVQKCQSQPHQVTRTTSTWTKLDSQTWIIEHNLPPGHTMSPLALRLAPQIAFSWIASQVRSDLDYLWRVEAQILFCKRRKEDFSCTSSNNNPGFGWKVISSSRDRSS